MDQLPTYSQSLGMLHKDGDLVASGWAGNGEGKNNPAMQNVRCVGPLPQGLWIVGVWQDHPRLGHLVAPLTQIEGETFGRDSFFIHGPSKNKDHYGQESMGCIVVPIAGRIRVASALPEGSKLRVVA